MRITVLANKDLASNVALNHLIPPLSKNHRVHIFLSSRVGGAGPLSPRLADLKFFEQTLFNELLFPALDKTVSGPGMQTFRQLARSYQVPLEELNDINTEQGLATLEASEPELILSVRYGGILRDKAIAIASKGVLNLHSGLLPDYRGVMATFYAMINGESRIGTTLHYIRDAGIDTGDIVDHTHCMLQTQHSYLWNVLQLYPAGIALMLETVAKLAADTPVESRAQRAQGSYYSFPNNDLLDLFGSRGFRLYDVEEITKLAANYVRPSP